MKRSAIFLLGLATLLAQNITAGSAVAWDGHGHVLSSVGYSVSVAKERVLKIAHQRYGANARIVAFTDLDGYGAIAVAAKGSGSVIGIALGKRSATEANFLAIRRCSEAGGTNPKVIRAFKG